MRLLRHNAALGHDETGYARLFVKTAEAVRKVQPDARIVALSLANAGGTVFIDGFFRYLDERDKIEYWQGETGCPSTFGSTGALSGYHWTELTQAKWNTRRAFAHLGRGYKFSLFLLSEFVYNDALRKGLNSKGLLKIDENDFSIKYAKPAYHAYQNLTSIFTHELKLITELDAGVVSDSSVSVFGWQNDQGEQVIAYWTDSSIPSDSTVGHKVSFDMKDIYFDEPVLVNTISGEVYSLPLRFSGIPCYDFPMLLAEKAMLPIEN